MIFFCKSDITSERNMAKVSIVDWSQNCIFVDGKPLFFRLPYDFKMKLKTAIFQTFGVPERTLLATKIHL